MNGADREERDQPEEAICRILVALDASPHSLAALQAAADLATRLDAEILGLYVEDIRLLRMSELPLAREINFFSPNPRTFNRQNAEVQLHAQAREARRAMERLMGRTQLRWSFRVVQGSIPQEVLAASQKSDLIALGKTGWSRLRRLGSTSRAVLTQALRPALFLQPGVRVRLPFGVIYDGSEQAVRALNVAAIMLGEGHLTVVILAGDVDTARGYQDDVARWLRQRNLNARFRWLVRPSVSGLKNIFEFEGCGLVVLPADTEHIAREAMAELLNEIECPVMLVR